MSKFYKETRYDVQAKRRDSNEKWSEWTKVNSYREALKHAKHIMELGYLPNIVVKDVAVQELWEILDKGNEVMDSADAILDAGFCKQSKTAAEIFRRINECLHVVEKSLDKEIFEANEEKQTEKMLALIGEKTVYRQVHSILDAVEQKYTAEKECPSCKHFMGCEPSTLGICDEYEEE